MSSDAIRAQPAPIRTAEPAVWTLVRADARRRLSGAAKAELVEDMVARDAEGRARYGVPLQASNGRDHLVDAYQEALDKCAYLRAEILATPQDARWSRFLSDLWLDYQLALEAAMRLRRRLGQRECLRREGACSS